MFAFIAPTREQKAEYTHQGRLKDRFRLSDDLSNNLLEPLFNSFLNLDPHYLKRPPCSTIAVIPTPADARKIRKNP